MRPLPRHRVALPAGLAALALAVAAPVAFALSVSSPVVVNQQPSPFSACTAGASANGVNYPNAEVEPWIAVNPTDSDNIIGVWQQDRWTDGGSHSNLTGVSADGGTTWSHPLIPWSTCAGNTNPHYNRATDPWVSFSPNGTAHQIALSISGSDATSAMLVSRSTDGGATWSQPITLIDENNPFVLNDKESITADPFDSNLVYAVWDRINKPGTNVSPNAGHSYAFRGTPMFSRSTDGGATWEKPRSIAPNKSNLFTIGNQIVVLPDGTLVDFFDLGKGSGVQPSIQDWKAVMRSTDHGLTWSKPIIIADSLGVRTRIPDGSFPVRAGGDDIAVAPDGTLYAAWTDGRFSGGAHNDIALSTSTDGGRTWSDPIRANQTPPSANVAAFTPSVQVNADGVVAVAYYDFRNDGPSAGVDTDYWLAYTDDVNGSWNEVRLTSASFDITTAPVAPASRGYFLGDYEGLDSFGSTFYNLFVVTTGSTSNRNDVEFVTVTP